jgi:hypothetical protein
VLNLSTDAGFALAQDELSAERLRVGSSLVYTHVMMKSIEALVFVGVSLHLFSPVLSLPFFFYLDAGSHVPSHTEPPSCTR